MAFYFGVAALTTALAMLVEGRRLSAGGGTLTRRRMLDYVCLSALFIILAGLAGLRIEVGNDYGKYVENFHEIWAGTDSAYVVTEIGFNIVVWLIYTLSGYENYLLVFALFGAGTAFFFLKAMDDESVDFGVSFMMFMLLGIYFRTFTTVRYYFALAVALYSIRFLRRRQYGGFCLWVVFAALFHKSALLVIPLYILAHLKWKTWFVWALQLREFLPFCFSSLSWSWL